MNKLEEIKKELEIKGIFLTEQKSSITGSIVYKVTGNSQYDESFIWTEYQIRSAFEHGDL
jgi:hypothetical protein